MRTSRTVACAAAALALVACGPKAPTSDGGTDVGNDGGNDGEVIFSASGTASVYPPALAWLADAGVANPGVAGLQLRVEEPLKVALSDPLGIFGTQTLAASGDFSVSGISSELVNLGVAAGLRDESGDAGTSSRIVRSATVLYDVALEGVKPRGDITGGKAYAVPTGFHDQLQAAITPARILTATGGLKSSLIEAGFVLGRIVDAAGNPVAGATLTPTPADRSARFFYPNAALDGVGTATASSGLFVFVHNASTVDTFRVNVTGDASYKQRSLGAAKDACLVVTFYPGTTPPP